MDNQPTTKARKLKRPRIYGVSRIDHERSHTHAWRVTLTRDRCRFTRPFSDGVHGGKRAALKAALIYRDEILKQHAPLSRQAYVQIKRRNNRSGVPGVCRSAKPRNRFGKRYLEWFWVASWTPQAGGAHKHKSFSIKSYGAQGAFRRAVAARRKGVAAMDSGPHITRRVHAAAR